MVMLALPSLIAMLNTLTIGVIERTRELGVLRAIGSTQKQVRHMVVTEAIILADIGTAFGLATGLYLGYLLVIGFGTIFPLGYAFPTAGIIASIVIGLGFGALAAIVPARQAARLQIVQAYRKIDFGPCFFVAGSGSRPIFIGWIPGLLAGLGLPGRLFGVFHFRYRLCDEIRSDLVGWSRQSRANRRDPKASKDDRQSG